MQERNRGQYRKHNLKPAGAPATWILYVMLVLDLREKSKVELKKVQSKVTDGWRAGMASLEGGQVEKRG